MAEQTLLQSPELDLKKHDGYSYSTHRSVIVEPALFLVAVAMSLSGAVVMQLFLVRSCEVTLSVNMSTCDLLVGHRDLPEAQQVELEAQPHAAVLQMAKMLTETCVPAILSMFLGPWSDMHGRKPLLVWPMLGYSAMFWTNAGLSMVRGLPPHYLLLASLPVALSGGFVSIISSTFAFMSDITAPDQRASRFLVGTYGSAHLFSLAGRFGYVAVFYTCASCCLAAYLYIFFLLRIL